MKQITFVIATMIFLFAAEHTFAQHGVAPDAYYPYNYNGDIFTGKVSSAEEDKQSITLVYESRKKTENFTGSLQKPCTVPSRNGQQMRVSDIPLGTEATVFYTLSTREVGGQKLARNSIFAITFDGESVSLFREPDAGKLPVRFDERELETGPSQTGLR
jgi:hypothetical protein